MRFLQVQRSRVSYGGDDKHEQHSADSDQTTEVKQAPSEAGHSCVWTNPKREIRESKKDADFRGAELREGHAKNANRICGQVTLNRQKEECDEHSGGDTPIESARNSEATHEEERSYGVDDMVHVKAVTRTLAIAGTRERAIEAVSEPVEREENRCQEQAEGIPAREGIACARKKHGDEAEERQMIRVDFCGRARGEPEENSAFRNRRKALLSPRSVLE